jgi:hypothetical protein
MLVYSPVNNDEKEPNKLVNALEKLLVNPKIEVPVYDPVYSPVNACA